MSSRGKLLFTLLSPLASSFPPLQDGSPITLHVSDHDLGSWIVGHDQILATQEAVRDGRYMSEEELKPFEKKEGRGPVKGLLSACPEDSRGWQVGLARKEGEEIDFTDRGEWGCAYGSVACGRLRSLSIGYHTCGVGENSQTNHLFKSGVYARS